MNHSERISTSSTRRIILVSVVIELLIIGLSFTTYGQHIEAAQAIARFSGRFSLLVFSILFVTNGSTRSRLLSTDPYSVFAVVHGIHLIELLIYVKLSGTQLIPYRVLGGAAAYAMIFVMPLLYRRFTHGDMGPRVFTIADNGYCYYVWFIFFMAYLPRVMGKLPQAGGTYTEHVTLFIVTIFILIIRLVQQSKNLKQLPQHSA